MGNPTFHQRGWECKGQAQGCWDQSIRSCTKSQQLLGEWPPVSSADKVGLSRTRLCLYDYLLSSRMAAHPSHLPSRSYTRASSWKTKPDLEEKLWKSLLGAQCQHQRRHADGEVLNCKMDLYEERQNDLSRGAERDAGEGERILSHCGLASWSRREGEKKWEEREARLEQLAHYKAMEGYQRVKKSFRTRQVLR